VRYADVVAWFAERSSTIDRSTIERWVQRFLPRFTEAAREHRRSGGEQWRGDQTYGRVHGQWVYI
jgi:IS6 family transposase